MARFNLSILCVVLAAWAVNISVAAPMALSARHHDEPTPSLIKSLAAGLIKRHKILPGMTQNNQGAATETGTAANNGTANNGTATETGTGANNGTATATPPLGAKEKADLVQCNIGASLFASDLAELANLVLQIDTAAAGEAVANRVEDVKTGIKLVGEGIGEVFSAEITASLGEQVNLSTKVEDGIKRVAGLNNIRSDQKDVLDSQAKFEELLATAAGLGNCGGGASQLKSLKA